MNRADVLDAVRDLAGVCTCPKPCIRTDRHKLLPLEVATNTLIQALALASQRAIDRAASPLTREEFHVSPATAKCDRSGTCSNVLYTVACPEAGCGKVYVRCENHGAQASAHRSLKSHRGLYHPKNQGDRT